MGIAASLLIALGTTTLAQSYEIKVDKRIEAHAAARAAIRIGDIRGTISFDETPAIQILETDEGQESQGGIDPLPTGSIEVPFEVRKPKIEWDVFDKYGRPVKR